MAHPLGLDELGRDIYDKIQTYIRFQLTGLFSVAPWLTAAAALGLITAAVYALWMLQQAFQGPVQAGLRMDDFGTREMLAMGAMMFALLWLGLYPQPVLDLAQPVLDGLLSGSNSVAGVLP